LALFDCLRDFFRGQQMRKLLYQHGLTHLDSFGTGALTNPGERGPMKTEYQAAVVRGSHLQVSPPSTLGGRISMAKLI